MMIATPTTAECMRYGGGWGQCVASPVQAAAPTWDATATGAPLRLWLKATQGVYHINDPQHAGAQMVNEWDDIVSAGNAFFYPPNEDAGPGPQFVPADSSGRPCVRFRGNAGECLQGFGIAPPGEPDPNPATALRLIADDGTIHASERALTLVIIAKVPLGGTSGATIAGYYSPASGAANLGVMPGYGWHTDPSDAYSNPPAWSVYAGVGDSSYVTGSTPTPLRGGTCVLYMASVSFSRYGGPGDYHVSIFNDMLTAPGVDGPPSSYGTNPWSSDYTEQRHGGIVYPTSGGNFFLGGPGRTGSLYATADLYEVLLWEGALTGPEQGLLVSYVQHHYA